MKSQSILKDINSLMTTKIRIALVPSSMAEAARKTKGFLKDTLFICDTSCHSLTLLILLAISISVSSGKSLSISRMAPAAAVINVVRELVFTDNGKSMEVYPQTRADSDFYASISWLKLFSGIRVTCPFQPAAGLLLLIHGAGQWKLKSKVYRQWKINGSLSTNQGRFGFLCGCSGKLSF